jgi:hypothetical protein
MTTLSPDQRRDLHELAISLIEADYQLQIARDLNDGARVRKVERRRDALRKQAAQWIVELDRQANAPVEA